MSNFSAALIPFNRASRKEFAAATIAILVLGVGYYIFRHTIAQDPSVMSTRQLVNNGVYIVAGLISYMALVSSSNRLADIGRSRAFALIVLLPAAAFLFTSSYENLVLIADTLAAGLYLYLFAAKGQGWYLN